LPPEADLGLRERKKVRTRSAIQHHALRLFREQGYEATTVTQIADAAEVSESTFFRYFGSKEAVVLEDDFDEELVALLRGLPRDLGPIAALRAAVRGAFAEITPAELEDSRQRAALFCAVPELRAALAGYLVGTIGLLSGLLAERLGRPADDLEVRALAGAAVGALMAVTMSPDQWMRSDFVELMDAALGQLETGFASLLE
jgi:AcrR family transcriptional regulator